jgi:hypothetical protein
MYQVPLIHYIDKDHERYQLAECIDRDGLEMDLAEY